MVYKVYQDGEFKRFIFPVEGKGLWSTLKGFLALNKDKNTIEGLTFYSHGETPGLGGEVDNPKWKAQWKGDPKEIKSLKAFDATGKLKVKVAKGKANNKTHEVDGLSGATLTANGVTYLVQFWLGDKGYGPYINQKL